MARAPNYGFEKQQRERARAEKNAARQKAKAEKKMPADSETGGTAESVAVDEGDASPPSAE